MKKQDMLDIHNIRQQFPILSEKAHGKPLVYLDNAATNQKPQRVIDALTHYYEHLNSNIHRGAHFLADKATIEYEATRSKIARFINSPSADQIIFTRGTTEGINLVASSYGRAFINEGDEIVISGMEHHSNIVPWQLLCAEKKAVLKVLPLHKSGEIIEEEIDKLITTKTKLVAVVYVSNALGTINPIGKIVARAKEVGAKILVDGAQSTGHFKIDVQKLDIDFYAFSAHKIYGPTGVGVLYGKRDVLEAMPPYQGGGEMIKEVSFEGTSFNEIPFKFEAGTPNIGDVIAFRAALEFIEEFGVDAISEHEDYLLRLATDGLKKIEGIRIIGEAKHKTGVVSFVLDGVHNYDLGMMLDAKGIAVRTGHHCTQPLMKFYGLEGTTRASFAVYNTAEEVMFFVESVASIKKMFG